MAEALKGLTPRENQPDENRPHNIAPVNGGGMMTAEIIAVAVREALRADTHPQATARPMAQDAAPIEPKAPREPSGKKAVIRAQLMANPELARKSVREIAEILDVSKSLVSLVKSELHT